MLKNKKKQLQLNPQMPGQDMDTWRNTTDPSSNRKEAR